MRKALVKRETAETAISVELNLDGTGQFDTRTGLRTLDHFIAQIARHGIFDIKVSATGSDQHHVVEDVAITFGKALNEALGDKRGIVRMANALVPMDEALSRVVLDISGRGYSQIDIKFSGEAIGELQTDMVIHFLETLASEAKVTLHATVLYGRNDHHMAESLFKALGRALDSATRIDPRIADRVPSTKDILEK